jgi:predicted permease
MIDFYERALDRIRTIPGVEEAGTVLTLPLHWAVRGSFGFSIQGRPEEEGQELLAGYQVASPGYFAALRIPVLRGRGFEESDQTEAPGVVVVSEALAQRYWPDTDVLGARITVWGDPEDPDTQGATVVGVVGTTVKEGLDRGPEPELYVPMRQGVMNASTFVVRAGRDPDGVALDLRSAVAEIDPNIPLYGVSSMEDVVRSSMARRRFRMLLIGVFAGSALLLAAVGLYGVISFTVGQRTREIGIRMALGAARDSVVAQVVMQGLARVGAGIALGLVASLAARRAIESQVFGVSPSDPLTYLTSAALFALVGVTACLFPAARAARVDPVSSVRVE